MKTFGLVPALFCLTGTLSAQATPESFLAMLPKLPRDFEVGSGQAEGRQAWAQKATKIKEAMDTQIQKLEAKGNSKEGKQAKKRAAMAEMGLPEDFDENSLKTMTLEQQMALAQQMQGSQMAMMTRVKEGQKAAGATTDRVSKVLARIQAVQAKYKAQAYAGRDFSSMGMAPAEEVFTPYVQELLPLLSEYLQALKASLPDYARMAKAEPGAARSGAPNLGGLKAIRDYASFLATAFEIPH